MTRTEIVATLSEPHRQALKRAHDVLENPDLAARLADYAGQPVQKALRMMPRAAGQRLNRIIETTVLQCLHMAIRSLPAAPARRPASRSSPLLAGISGAFSGFFGVAALPVELPLTTTLILRAVADIARRQGEDLTKLEARLACVEVLGLGARARAGGLEVGYYASRALLSRLVDEATSLVVERGVAGAAAPAVGGMVADIAPRFGLVVSERISASALPVVGALGGATLNFLFTSHFQRIAHAHFTVRRLERLYGIDTVRRHYASLTEALQKR